jgi:hypothetical protein
MPLRVYVLIAVVVGALWGTVAALLFDTTLGATVALATGIYTVSLLAFLFSVAH